MAEKFRVRFAPSPTGRLHIGGGRTSLFNFIFAKQQKADFILRIDDTDEARNKPEFEEDIKDQLNWLGIVHDEYYRQSDRMDLYKKYVDELLSKDLAYEKEGAIFFRMPTENREIIVDDLIRGKVTFQSKDFDDLVIVKSGGMPTYHFASAMDDVDLKITHVIRAEEHLSNTPKHILLFDAFGFEHPKYAHIPLILNTDRSKMSKRSGDTALGDYRDAGYLPEAMIDFLAHLGWAPSGDIAEKEFFTFEELVKYFDFEHVQKAGAVFDIQKLNHINHHYLAQKSSDEYLQLAGPFVKSYEGNPDLLQKALHLIQDRAEKLSDIPTLIDYFFNLPDYPGALLVFRKSSPEQTAKGLDAALKTLSAYEGDWEETKLKSILDETMAAESLMPGDLFWPIRVALSGNEASPSPTELLDALGKDESLSRLKLAIGKLAG